MFIFAKMYMVMFVYNIQYTTVYMFVYNAQHNVNEHEQLIIYSTCSCLLFMNIFCIHDREHECVQYMNI